MFADLLNALCSRSDHPVTNVSLARELAAQGCPISTAYLSQLRTDVRTQPTSRIVHALATHFGVSAEYFYPTTTTGKGNAGITDPATVDKLLDPSLRRLLAGSQDLPTTSQHLLTELADRLRTAESLPLRCADSPTVEVGEHPFRRN